MLSSWLHFVHFHRKQISLDLLRDGRERFGIYKSWLQIQYPTIPLMSSRYTFPECWLVDEDIWYLSRIFGIWLHNEFDLSQWFSQLLLLISLMKIFDIWQEYLIYKLMLKIIFLLERWYISIMDQNVLFPRDWCSLNSKLKNKNKKIVRRTTLTVSLFFLPTLCVKSENRNIIQ